MPNFSVPQAPILVFASALGAVSCSVSLVDDLEGQTATLVATALVQSGVAAEKTNDPAHDGKFVVEVGRGDASFALAVMAREHLPPTPRLGLAQTLNGGSFIASRDEEHARWILGTASELETSLASMPHIITARVHLAVSRQTLLRPGHEPLTNRASVLLRHAQESLPFTVNEVQNLVAGAVPGLHSQQVVVVSKQVPPLAARGDSELVRLGPLTTTRGSLPYFQWMIAGVAFLNISMVALLIALWRKTRSGGGASRSKRTLQRGG